MLRRRGGLFLLPLLMAVLLRSAVPCWSQARPPRTETAPRTFYIRGALRTADEGRPIEMVRVDLKRLTGEIVGTTFSRSMGEFEFGGLPNGVYYVVVEEKGYEPVRESVEIFNTARAGVLIFLKRNVVLGPSEPGQIVSAHELTIPRRAREAVQKGMARLYEKQDPKGSLNHFQRAVAEVPSYYEAYLQMGVAYMRLGQAAEAEQAVRKSIELSEGRYSEAHFALAQLLSNTDRFAEAEPVARRGVELDGNTWQGHYELARALVGLNRLDAAEKSAREAKTRKPDLAVVYLILANVHIRKRNYPVLLQDLDGYLKLEPNGPMSDKARQMRESVQRALADAQNAQTAGPTKP